MTERDVWQAADALLLAGRRPTIEAVRQHLGGGSPNTVTPYLDTWFKGLGRRLQDPGAFAAPAGIPEPVAAAATHFWEAAMAAARSELAAQQGQLEAARKEVEAERQALAAQAAQYVAAEKALSEALSLAKEQLAGALESGQRWEARCAALAKDHEAVTAENKALRTRLDEAQTRHAAELKSLHDARQEDASRLEAAERRWLQETDRARELAKAATEARQRAERNLAASKKASEEALEAARAREAGVQAELAKARTEAASASTRVKALDEQRTEALKRLQELEARVQLVVSEIREEKNRANEQLAVLLRNFGMTLTKPVLSAFEPTP